jgi:hypothetical protein
MDNRFIFRYRPVAVMSDGGTREGGRGAALEMPSSKPAGVGVGKSASDIPRGVMGSSWGNPRATALGLRTAKKNL